MKNLCFVSAALVLCLAAPFTKAGETDANKPGPIIIHTPILTVLRGQPADITAQIQVQGSLITSAIARVKLEPVGKPIAFPMSPGKDGLFQTAIPVSLIQPVDRFWYYLHADDGNGRSKDTVWFEVKIIDAAHGGEAAAKDSSHKAAWWIAGGALAGGAVLAAVIANNNNGHGNGGSDSAPVVTAPTPKPKPKPAKKADTKEETPPPCILTGGETVTYAHLDTFFSDPNPIEILVCNTCPDATISASATWGASDSKGGYNNALCSGQDPALLLHLAKPVTEFTAPDSETITVFANGQMINSITWPRASPNP